MSLGDDGPDLLPALRLACHHGRIRPVSWTLVELTDDGTVLHQEYETEEEA
jgi:hypothetical protein